MSAVMYISVYPVVITMRHSNVYEERSLGIYADDMDTRSTNMPFSSPPGGPGYAASATPSSNFVDRVFRNVFSEWEGVGATHAREKETPISFISYQVRGQLSHDLWWLVLAVLLITIVSASFGCCFVSLGWGEFLTLG
jgi:Trk-type K+ transport system membrane component